MISTSTLSPQLFFLRIAYIKAHCFLFRAYLKWGLINVPARPPPTPSLSEMQKASHHFKNVSHFHPGWAVGREGKQVGRRGGAERIICGCCSERSWLMPDYSCSRCLRLRFSLTVSHTHTYIFEFRQACWNRIVVPTSPPQGLGHERAYRVPSNIHKNCRCADMSGGGDCLCFPSNNVSMCSTSLGTVWVENTLDFPRLKLHAYSMHVTGSYFSWWWWSCYGFLLWGTRMDWSFLIRRM